MTSPIFSIQITETEFRARCDGLAEYLRAQNLSGAVLFDADYIKYYTGFTFIPTERPMAFAMNSDGGRALFVPRLELEHAQANALIEQVAHYPEYPSLSHPMNSLAELLQTMGISGRIGCDEDGYPWIFGYRGPALSELTGAAVVRVRGFIEEAMAIKSPAEIELLRESIRWANLAHRLLQRYTVVGASETEVSDRAGQEATRAMLDAIGPIYRGQSAYYGGAIAGYRGQIGRNSEIPHALGGDIRFQAGDVLVTGASAPVWGYVSELERIMFMGQPSPEAKTFFDHATALQDIAFEAIKPGQPCSVVEYAAREYAEKHDLMKYWKHHIGHAIGLRYHEGPFLDVGDSTIMQPGMIFTVEPGLYVSGLGGFRHSDTVRVTEDGIELMTYYPRDLVSLTIGV